MVRAPSLPLVVRIIISLVLGHQWLFQQGVLHRDISAGNILLSANPHPKSGEEGFITDLDLAKVLHEKFQVSAEEVVVRRSVRLVTSRPGGDATRITSSAVTGGATITVSPY